MTPDPSAGMLQSPNRTKPNGHAAKKAAAARPTVAAPPPLPIPKDRTEPLPPRDGLRHLLHVVKAMRQGNFSVRCAVSDGIVSEIGEVMNDIIEMNENMAKEF